MNTTKIFAAAALIALSGLAGCHCWHHGHGHGEAKGGMEHGEKCGKCTGHGVAVTPEQVPYAVRATIEREAAGGRINEVEREMRHGRAIYSADITVNGVDWDLEVAENGTVLNKGH